MSLSPVIREGALDGPTPELRRGETWVVPLAEGIHFALRLFESSVNGAVYAQARFYSQRFSYPTGIPLADLRGLPGFRAVIAHAARKVLRSQIGVHSPLSPHDVASLGDDEVLGLLLLRLLRFGDPGEGA